MLCKGRNYYFLNGTNDLKCKNQECDYYSDCMDNTDEKECPAHYMFDNCERLTGLHNCGWEEMPHDSLDWVIAKKNDTASTSHPIPREGEFLWIQRKEGSIAEATARIHSSEYQNSRSTCRILFWYYIAGDMGSAYIKPLVHIVEEATDIVLDYLVENNGWNETSVEIGRRKGRFEVFLLSSIIVFGISYICR